MSKKDKFIVLVCSPKDVATQAGGETREEAENTARELKREGWVVIEVRENPASHSS